MKRECQRFDSVREKAPNRGAHLAGVECSCLPQIPGSEKLRGITGREGHLYLSQVPVRCLYDAARTAKIRFIRGISDHLKGKPRQGMLVGLCVTVNKREEVA